MRSIASSSWPCVSHVSLQVAAVGIVPRAHRPTYKLQTTLSIFQAQMQQFKSCLWPKRRAATAPAAFGPLVLAAANTDLAERRQPPKVNVTFTFKIEGRCELSITGSLGESEAQGTAAVVAMFHFFRNRSKRLAAAVQHVLDPKPTLHSLLTPDGATLAAELKARPLEAVQLLDSFGNLMVLAKAAVPHVAEAIEAEMDEEVAKLRRRTKEGVGTEGQQFSESAAAPDAVLAVNLVSTPQWEHWKTRLINALIETLPSEDMQNTQDSAALKLRCECRTSDDATGLIAGLEVRASGPQVGAVMEAGPEADDASKMLFFLMFSDKPESALQTELAAAVWNAAQLTPGAEGASFFCTLGQKPAAESPQGGPETSETAAETDWIELHGSGEELLSLVMVMATLEAGELPGVGGSSGGVGRWVPADGRIQLRRQETPSKRLKTATYLVRVGDSDGGEGVVRQFSHREALALVDCLDAFCQLSPAFGLPEPRAHVGSVSVWQRAVNLLPF